jgi:hypothetical protein
VTRVRRVVGAVGGDRHRVIVVGCQRKNGGTKREEGRLQRPGQYYRESRSNLIKGLVQHTHE